MNLFKCTFIAIIVTSLLVSGCVFLRPVVSVIPPVHPGSSMMFRYDAGHTGNYTPVAGHMGHSVSLLWRYQTKWGMVSSPSVADGVVYIGSDDGNVYALNATQGNLYWKFQATKGAFGGVDGGPAVWDGKIFAGALDPAMTSFALNVSEGSLVWHYRSHSTPTSPALANGNVYLWSIDYNVTALNATNGMLEWNRPVGSATDSSPAVVNNVVYIGCDDPPGTLYALNASTGALVWNISTGEGISTNRGGISSSPAVSDGILYIGSWDHNLYAINASTGARIWKYTTGGRVRSSPAVANSEVFFGSDDYNIYALDAKTGSFLWSYTTGGAVKSSPAVANTEIFVGSDDGNIYALDARSGSLIWKFKTDGRVESSPAIVNGVIYVGSDDGDVYALDTNA